MLSSSRLQKRSLVLLLGDVDTGKSTLCRQLAQRGLEQGLRVGVVDADVGQSWIGPPTTIGMKVLDGKAVYEPADALFFVGAISPEKHLAEMVVGTRQMADRCRAAGAEVVLVDTTGLVLGGFGQHLKWLKIEHLCPDHIVAIQRSGELGHLLHRLRTSARYTIHRVECDPQLARKSREKRRRYREDQFETYFGAATEVNFSLHEVSLRRCQLGAGCIAKPSEIDYLSSLMDGRVLYAEWSHRAGLFVPEIEQTPAQMRHIQEQLGRPHMEQLAPNTYVGHLVGLSDMEESLCGLGVVRAIHWEEGRLTVLTGVDADRVRSIEMGDYAWANR